MKIFNWFIACAMCAAPLFEATAQDVLVKRNGDELQVKVLKISQAEVEYKKWSNQDGPTYTLPKADVFMVKYQNGDKDVFSETAPTNAPATSTMYGSGEEDAGVAAAPAENNEALIREYNLEQHEYNIKDSKKSHTKPANAYVGTLGVTSTSILSTKDIEITLRQAQEGEMSFMRQYEIGDEFSLKNDGNVPLVKYVIEITNKSSKVIYVDKASCFRTSSTGKTRYYYNSNKVSTVSSGNNGVGVNMGAVTNAMGVGGVVGSLANGVTVGGGKQNSTIVEHQNERLLVIPPKGKVLLSKDDYIDIKGGNDLVTGISENLVCPRIEGLLRNEVQEFTEENSPMTYNYMITYSFSNELYKCNSVNFGVYLKDAYGFPKAIFNFLWLSKSKINDYFRSTSPRTIVVWGMLQ